MRLEGGDDARVELDAGVPPELDDRLLRARRLAIAAIGRDRVIFVGDEDKPGAERDLLEADRECPAE